MVLCSTVVAGGDATKNGEVLFGRNLDFIGRNILHRTTVCLVYETPGKTPLVSVTWPGLVPFARIRPLILGLPFSMAWIAAWIAGSVIVLFLLDRVERRYRPDGDRHEAGGSD